MRLKHLLRYPLDVRRAERLLIGKAAPANASLPHAPVVLKLRTRGLLIDGGRHLACLAEHARSAGSALWLQCDRPLLAEIAHKLYGRHLLAARSVRWLGRETAEALPPGALVLHDDVDSGEERPAAAPRRFRLLIGREATRGSAVMPYPMHPNHLRQTSPDQFERLRRCERRRGIFFAGNQKMRYHNVQLEHQFGVLSRPRVLKTLRQHFADRIRGPFFESEPDSSSGASPQPAGAPAKTPLILRDADTDPIAWDRWLAALARADFFLCPPGASQPVCHNLVEAMSVGTIPVVEYGDRLTPPLDDRAGAVCFRGAPGLVRAIHRIDRMSASEIDQRRRSVIKYYETHLRGDRFLAALRDGRLNPPSRQISMPFHDRDLFRLESRPGGVAAQAPPPVLRTAARFAAGAARVPSSESSATLSPSSPNWNFLRG